VPDERSDADEDDGDREDDRGLHQLDEIEMGIGFYDFHGVSLKPKC
jgi:hypothetical protein